MALKWLDGFESYGTVVGNNPKGLFNKYTSNFASDDTSYTLQTGRGGGKAIRIAGSTTINTPVFTAQDTWTIGFGLFHDRLASSQPVILIVKDSTTAQCSVALSVTGELQFYRGSASAGGTLLFTTSGAKIRCGVWQYIEVKVKINNTTGTIDIHVNGVSVLSQTSVNTRNGAANQATNFALQSSPAAADHTTFDDFYVCDNQGSNNTTFLGPQKVTIIFPTGDHGTNQWTTSGAGTTHADRVKENPHDASTTYVTDTVSGNTEEWDYADSGSEITSIKGIMLNTVFETDSAGAFSVKAHASSGGTVSDDAGTAGTNGTYKNPSPFLLETDPNTSALWTKTNLDAAIFGVKVV